MNCMMLLGESLGEFKVHTAGENRDGSIVLGLRCSGCGAVVDVVIRQGTITPVLCKNCRKICYILPFSADKQIYDIEVISRYKYNKYKSKAGISNKEELYKYIINCQSED